MYQKITSIQTLSLTSNATNYAFTIPKDTRKLIVKERTASNDVKMALTEADMASGAYITINAGSSGYYVEGVYLSEQVIYFNSPTNSVTLEILILKDNGT